jgi:hypothetical protein
MFFVTSDNMAKLVQPKPPAKADWPAWVRYHERLRKYDAQRIALRLATPEQVQRENSIFSPEDMTKVKIDWGGVFSSLRR